MESKRRQDVYNSTRSYSTADEGNITRAAQVEEMRKQRILNSLSYKLTKQFGFVMDKCFLDPIIGFFFPEGGDVIAALAGLPAIYVSAFVVRDFKLTLAVTKNILVDLLIGAVPWVGDICDFFYRSNWRNYNLITGFVEGDREAVSQVNKSAVGSIVMIIVLIGLLALTIWLVVSVFHLFGSLFSWVFGR